MIIDCISDLHGYEPELEGGDLLIVAGDLTARDTPAEHLNFIEWLKNQNYKKKIVIAGNHDGFIQKLKSSYFHYTQTLVDGMEYLCDSGCEFEGLKIWGTPWSNWFHGINPHCKAFTGSENDLAKKYALIPDDTDILISHGPSFGNLDITKRGESVGSLSLWLKLLQFRPKLHVFGHIHEAYGEVTHANGIHLVNASHVNEDYEPVNRPIRVIL